MSQRPRPLRRGRSYTPASHNDWGAHWLCRHCWHPEDGHRRNGRCYTLVEIEARLAWWERTGQWPGPDQVCTPQKEKS
jgi:hypothetical protein